MRRDQGRWGNGNAANGAAPKTRHWDPWRLRPAPARPGARCCGERHTARGRRAVGAGQWRRRCRHGTRRSRRSWLRAWRLDTRWCASARRPTTAPARARWGERAVRTLLRSCARPRGTNQAEPSKHAATPFASSTTTAVRCTPPAHEARCCCSAVSALADASSCTRGATHRGSRSPLWSARATHCGSLSERAGGGSACDCNLHPCTSGVTLLFNQIRRLCTQARWAPAGVPTGSMRAATGPRACEA